MVVLSKVAHSKSRGFQSFLFQKFFQIHASKTKKKTPRKSAPIHLPHLLVVPNLPVRLLLPRRRFIRG